MHEQRRRRQDRRWGRVGAELAVGGDDRGPAVAPAEPAIGAELEVLARLFLEVLSRRRRAGREPCRDRLVQAAEAAPVRGDAVQADERRSLGLAPFVQMEEHQLVPVKEPANAGSVSRQSPATATSAVPVTGSAELLKTTITAAFTDAAACSKSSSVSTAT